MKFFLPPGSVAEISEIFACKVFYARSCNTTKAHAHFCHHCNWCVLDYFEFLPSPSKCSTPIIPCKNIPSKFIICNDPLQMLQFAKPVPTPKAHSLRIMGKAGPVHSASHPFSPLTHVQPGRCVSVQIHFVHRRKLWSKEKRCSPRSAEGTEPRLKVIRSEKPRFPTSRPLARLCVMYYISFYLTYDRVSLLFYLLTIYYFNNSTNQSTLLHGLS